MISVMSFDQVGTSGADFGANNNNNNNNYQAFSPKLNNLKLFEIN